MLDTWKYQLDNSPEYAGYKYKYFFHEGQRTVYDLTATKKGLVVWKGAWPIGKESVVNVDVQRYNVSYLVSGGVGAISSSDALEFLNMSSRATELFFDYVGFRQIR